eukprot:TRINITY_DN458_c0_g4_i1.p4 TRINITY_DN458_c0_g4~~TRINITY_DN458_c0_g4_i1.p4  ORF type:complete len:117 (+),score=16.09 TRINITY_DN458_c0_g4_i1:5126-5476(+)
MWHARGKYKSMATRANWRKEETRKSQGLAARHAENSTRPADLRKGMEACEPKCKEESLEEGGQPRNGSQWDGRRSYQSKSGSVFLGEVAGKWWTGGAKVMAFPRSTSQETPQVSSR